MKTYYISPEIELIRLKALSDPLTNSFDNDETEVDPGEDLGDGNLD